MRLWVDVLNADGERLGPGPVVAAQTATVQRVLDGAGGWSLSLPAAEQRHLDLLVEGHYVAIWGEQNGALRALGGGQIEAVTLRGAVDGAVMQVKGPDRLAELKHASTLLGRQYSSAPIAAVASELAGLAGWTAVVESGLGATTLEFNGESALKALQTLIETHGLHLRLGEGERVVEIGTFGEDCGVRLIQRRMLGIDVYDNPHVTLIESITAKRDEREIVNWLLPLGAKEQAPRVTLGQSTRTGPYTIQSIAGPDGTTLYYLSDATSAAQYGERQVVKVYDQVKAASTAPADMTSAANALYDAAASDLARANQRQESYDLTLVGVKQTIRPGDLVRVVYQGAVERDGERVAWLDTDDLYWVVEVSETWGSEGHNVSMSVSNVDRVAEDAAQTVARTVAKVRAMEV